MSIVIVSSKALIWELGEYIRYRMGGLISQLIENLVHFPSLLRFVQEAWMESSLFSCATGGKSAEYDILDGFGQSKKGVSSAKAYMEKHWVSGGHSRLRHVAQIVSWTFPLAEHQLSPPLGHVDYRRRLPEDG